MTLVAVPAHLVLEPALRGLLRAEGLAAAAAFEPVGDEEPPWLGASERLVLDRLTVPKRRREWLAGRRAAKRAVAALAGVAGQVEIVAAPDGAPEARTGDGRAAGVTIAHAGQVAGAVAWPDGDRELGLDLEPLVEHTRFLDAVALSPDEQAWARAGGAGPERVLGLWTAKEAVLKVLRLGLRADLRRVVVSPAEPGEAWLALHEGERFRIRHVEAGGYVVALAFRQGMRD